MTTSLQKDIAERFDYREPTDRNTELHIHLRKEFQDLALRAASHLPPSRYRSLMLTAIEDAHHWAHAAIARKDENDQDTYTV